MALCCSVGSGFFVELDAMRDASHASSRSRVTMR